MVVDRGRRQAIVGSFVDRGKTKAPVEARGRSEVPVAGSPRREVMVVVRRRREALVEARGRREVPVAGSPRREVMVVERRRREALLVALVEEKKNMNPLVFVNGVAATENMNRHFRLSLFFFQVETQQKRKWCGFSLTCKTRNDPNRKGPTRMRLNPRDPLTNGPTISLSKPAPHGSCTGQARELRSICHSCFRMYKLSSGC